MSPASRVVSMAKRVFSVLFWPRRHCLLPLIMAAGAACSAAPLGDDALAKPQPGKAIEAGQTQPEPRQAKPPEPAGKQGEQPAPPMGPPAPQVWPPDAIKEAAAECSRLLRNQPLDYETLQPIKDGACGAPAPLKLKGYAGEPKLEIRPAATLTCKMALALHRWLQTIVQPRAKELLHANVIRLGNVSSYHCRHRYNDPSQPMSHHAFANAIDVGEFVTAKGERISVLEHWPGSDERAAFLKDIHKGACGIFGTVIGPERDAAHKNHFHLDMASRKRALCE